jgi:hypothetical protein
VYTCTLRTPEKIRDRKEENKNKKGKEESKKKQ